MLAGLNVLYFPASAGWINLSSTALKGNGNKMRPPFNIGRAVCSHGRTRLRLKCTVKGRQNEEDVEAEEEATRLSHPIFESNTR